MSVNNLRNIKTSAGAQKILMRIKKILAFLFMSLCFLLFQNCGGESTDEFDQPFLIELDEENILSKVHALELPNNIGFSKIYIKKADEESELLILEIATSKGDFIKLDDFTGALNDYLDFEPAVLEGNNINPRLILLSDTRDRIIEISVNDRAGIIRIENEIDLIENVNPRVLANLEVEFEGQDRLISLGLNEILFSGFMGSLIPVSPQVNCIEDYTNVDQRCLQDRVSCSVDGGRGFRTLENDRYGPCFVENCQGNYILHEERCVRASRSCTLQNAQGLEYFVPSTGSYGECQPLRCNSGYAQNSEGVCIRLRRLCNIANGRGIQIFDFGLRAYRACAVESCSSGFIRNGNQCVENETSCNLAGATSSTRSFDITTGVYGACEAAGCVDGYTLTGQNTCAESFRSCQISNGTGRRDYNAGTNSYGPCRAFSCGSGFSANSTRTECVGTTRSCPFENGQGIQRYTGVDRVYGSCTLRTCNNGYVRTNTNICTARVRACSIPNASVANQTYNSTTNSYGSCVLRSCNRGYIASRNACFRFNNDNDR